MAGSSGGGRVRGPDLEALLRRGRRIRAIGFDDGPFERGRRGLVPVAGVVTAGTRFEGMLWGRVRQDGWDATARLAEMVRGSKFHAQLHVVLLDGIALGGFNVVDLPGLALALGLPCVAFMRRWPDREAVELAIGRLPRPAARLEVLGQAGPIHGAPPRLFQVAGAEPDVVERALGQLTDTGHVPECLRLAHLVAGAVVTGQSGRRA